MRAKTLASQKARTGQKARAGQKALAGLTVASLALFGSHAPAGAQEDVLGDAGITLTADELFVEDNGQLLRAVGEVEFSLENRRLSAREVTYDRRTGRAAARGDVVVITGEGAVFFADEVDLSTDFSEGAVGGVGLLLGDGAKLAAADAERGEDGVTVMRRAVYGSCAPCEDGEDPIWRIRADEVRQDPEEGVVSYKNATFELFGAPIAWTPWFAHSDPSVARRTGFLAPSFGTDSILGVTVETPFYFDIAPNRDAVLTPMFTTDEGVVLFGELRDLQRFGYTTLEGSVTRGDAPLRDADDTDGSSDFRGHLAGSGRYVRPGDQRSDAIAAGFDLSLASDDTYLSRYNIGEDDILTNRLFVDRIWRRNWLIGDAYYFQGLRPTDEQDQIPIVLPRLRGHIEGDVTSFGGRPYAEVGFLALTRLDGLDTRRLDAGIGLRGKTLSPMGAVWSYDLALRGDLYSIDGDPVDRSDNGGSEVVARIVPSVTAGWSLPLERVGGDWRQIVEPIVSFDWTPPNLDSDDIPNEDSRDVEFDDTNLFDHSRFTGIDRTEGGAKVTYGARYSAFSRDGFRIGGLLGQSFRFEDDDAFEPGSGLAERRSNIVGRLDLAPSPNLELLYRFRLDDDSFVLQRSNLGLLVGPPDFRLSLDYLFASADDGPDTVEREQITVGARVRLFDDLVIAAEARRDLETDSAIHSRLGFAYTQPSLTIVAGVEQDFTSDRDAGDTTTYSLRVTFTNLTDFETRGNLSDG